MRRDDTHHAGALSSASPREMAGPAMMRVRSTTFSPPRGVLRRFAAQMATNPAPGAD